MTDYSTHTEGYKNALVNVDNFLSDSIQRNNNAQSAGDVLNVLNDMVAYIHHELNSIPHQHEEEEVPDFTMDFTAEDVAELLQSAFGDVPHIVVKRTTQGGR